MKKLTAIITGLVGCASAIYGVGRESESFRVVLESYNSIANGTSDGGTFSVKADFTTAGDLVASDGGTFLNRGDVSATNSSVAPPVNLMVSFEETVGESDGIIGVGGKISFSVEAEGELLTYQWLYSEDGSTFVDIEGESSDVYELTESTSDNSGFYAVEVSNSGGIATSESIEVSVLEVPVIVTDLEDQTGIQGEALTLSVEATVEGTPSYRWEKDTVEIEGQTTSSLELSDLSADDEGNYVVIISNEVGDVSSRAAMVEVIEPPVILFQPEDFAGVPGGEASFTVDARVEGTESYVWYKDGVAIAGVDESTLVLSGIGLDDVGAYSVEISNEAGSVNSTEAVLSLVSDSTVAPSALAGSSVVGIGEDSITYSSDWFGEFTVSNDGEFGYVWTQSLGWTYFTSISTPEASYILPLIIGGIIYTNEDLYPDYAYSYVDESWMFFNPSNDVSTGSIWIYVYSTEEWVEYSE